MFPVSAFFFFFFCILNTFLELHHLQGLHASILLSFIRVPGDIYFLAQLLKTKRKGTLESRQGTRLFVCLGSDTLEK